MKNGHMQALIPGLRRYGRYLCGNSAETDCIIGRLLNGLLEGSVELDTSMSPRVALFHAFHKYWVAVDHDDLPVGDCLSQILRPLHPLDRSVFLLSEFEDLPAASVARVLEIPLREAELRLDRAARLTGQKAAKRVLILEDEALTALELESLVIDLGMEALAPASTSLQAIAAALDHCPDLILSDIELQGETSGIDAVGEIRRSFDVPVVFITAYPRRVTDRLYGARTFVLPKPINWTKLTSLIDRALATDGGAISE